MEDDWREGKGCGGEGRVAVGGAGLAGEGGRVRGWLPCGQNTPL
jgi:hypothetical protein